MDVEKHFRDYLLRTETTLTGKLKNIALALVLLIAWIALFDAYGRCYFMNVTMNDTWQFMSPWELFFRCCIIAPLWEELAYRYAPLTIAKRLGEKKFIVPAILLSSIIFGYGHGSVGNIFLQGIGGLMCCIVYVKNGYSLWSSLLLHFLWNCFFQLAMPALNL